MKVNMFKNTTEVEVIKKQQNQNLKYGVRFLALAMLAGLPTIYHIMSGQQFPLEKTWYTQALNWSNNILNLCSIFYFYKVYMGARMLQNMKIVDELSEKYQKDFPALPQSDKEIFMFYNPQKEKEL